MARYGGAGAEATFNAFAELAGTYPWEEPAKPTAGSSAAEAAGRPAAVLNVLTADPGARLH